MSTLWAIPTDIMVELVDDDGKEVAWVRDLAAFQLLRAVRMLGSSHHRVSFRLLQNGLAGRFEAPALPPAARWISGQVWGRDRRAHPVPRPDVYSVLSVPWLPEGRRLVSYRGRLELYGPHRQVILRPSLTTEPDQPIPTDPVGDLDRWAREVANQLLWSSAAWRGAVPSEEERAIRTLMGRRDRTLLPPAWIDTDGSLWIGRYRWRHDEVSEFDLDRWSRAIHEAASPDWVAREFQVDPDQLQAAAAMLELATIGSQERRG